MVGIVKFASPNIARISMMEFPCNRFISKPLYLISTNTLSTNTISTNYSKKMEQIKTLNKLDWHKVITEKSKQNHANYIIDLPTSFSYDYKYQSFISKTKLSFTIWILKLSTLLILLYY